MLSSTLYEIHKIKNANRNANAVNSLYFIWVNIGCNAMITINGGKIISNTNTSIKPIAINAIVAVIYAFSYKAEINSNKWNRELLC